MSTENDDQRHEDTDQAPDPVEDAAATSTEEPASEPPGGDVWQEATEQEATEQEATEEAPADEPAAAEEPAAGETPPVAEPAATSTAETAGAEPADVPTAEPVQEPVDQPVAEEVEEVEGETVPDDAEPRLSAVPDADDVRQAEPVGSGSGRAEESTAEDAAKQFISSVEGFLGSVFKDASETVEKLTSKGKEQARKSTERATDPTEFLESVESWVGDFFRGAPGKAARGFGKAAAGSAFRSATNNRNDDVWASATAEDSDRDASRECRYCPFCQTLAAVRNTRPELYDQIGDTAQRLVDLVKQAAEQSRGRRPW